MPPARVRGADGHVAEQSVRHAIALGAQRAFEQDPKYAIRLLVDVAIRPLSPAVNDPTTAVQALDQIGDLLLRLGWRRLEVGTFRDAAGAVRVAIPVASWDGYLRLGLVEILACGAGSMQVMRRMNALVSGLIAALDDERRPALEARRARIRTTIARAFTDPIDLRDALADDR